MIRTEPGGPSFSLPASPRDRSVELARARPDGRPSGLDRQLSCGWATDEDANAFKISTDYRGQHAANPVITGWQALGFTPKYERYDRGTQAQKGPMTEEQKAERKTLITNSRDMESATKVRASS